jgi:hypothetical protein
MVVGYYATMHSSLGQPTARYVSRLLQTIALRDGVLGIMTYTLKSALAPCVGGPLFGGELQHSLGCVVGHAYAAIAGTSAAAAPAPAAAAAAPPPTFSAGTVALSAVISALGGALVAVAAARLIRARSGGSAGEAGDLGAGTLSEKLLSLN